MPKGDWTLLLALLGLPLALAQSGPSIAQALPWSPDGYEGLPQYPIHLTHTYPPEEARFPGFFQVAYDGEALYLYASLKQPSPPRGERGAEDREWWRDDTLEVFLRPDPWNPETPDLHLAVNPKGVRFRAYTAPLDYEARTGETGEGWWVELRLPFGSLLPRPSPGTFWQLKGGRGYPEAGEYTLWPKGGDFHSPGNYGYLVFLEHPGNPQTLAQEVARRENQAPPIPSRLVQVRRWAVYYGGDPGALSRLLDYDLVVLAREAPLAGVRALREAGVRVVAYLPVGLLPLREAQEKGLLSLSLGTNPYVPGTVLMNPASPLWREWVLKEAKRLWDLGFEGFFLDGLDLADLHPENIPPLASLVRRLRAELPGAILIQHRGFRVLRGTAEALDALVYSGLSVGPDGRPFPGDPSPVWPFRARGLLTLSLDLSRDPEVRAWAEARAIKLGFVPYVAPGELTSLP